MKRERSDDRGSRSSKCCSTLSEGGAAGGRARAAPRTASFYIYSAFMLVYATQHSHIDRNVALNGIMLASALRVHRDPALRRAVRSHRPPAGLHVRRRDDGRPRVPAVLALRHGLDGAGRRSRCCWRSCARTRRCTRRRARSSPSCSARASATAARRSARSCRRPWPAASRRSSRPFLLPRYGRSAIALYIIFMALITIVAVMVGG